LITGVSKGLGKSIALKFKKEGFIISGVSRSKPDFNLDLHIKADLTDKNSHSEIVNKTVKNFGKIDILINNAGVGLYESWENIKDEDLRYLFELNFFSVINLTKSALPFLKETKGTVINVSSVAGKLYVPYMGGYCASKYALNAFSDSLRAELKPFNIHVLNLIVGRINTGFSERSLGTKIPPSTPFGGDINKFAEKVYQGYVQRKREVTYPYWYRFIIYFSKIFPNLYDKIALKKWNE
jgi:short-subunit dehydrogenase